MGSSGPVPRALDPQTLGDHLDRLFRAAWALSGSREDAEDLVQDTYERVLRRPQVVAQLDDVQAQSSRAEVQPERAAETRLVLEAVAELPEPMREVLVAVDVLGLSYAEAGKALGVHENTVPSRLARARLKVAEALQG